MKVLGEACRRAAGNDAADPRRRCAGAQSRRCRHGAAGAVGRRSRCAPPRRSRSMRSPSALRPVVRRLCSSSCGAIRNGVTRPVFITQHMPATFTTILAEHITRSTGWPAAEAVDGEAVRPGRVYVAPGDFHMIIEGDADRREDAAAEQDAAREFLPPVGRSDAAQPGSDSMAAACSASSSPAWGMTAVPAARRSWPPAAPSSPRTRRRALSGACPARWRLPGLCSAVLPLREIGPYLCKLAMRSAA